MRRLTAVLYQVTLLSGLAVVMPATSIPAVRADAAFPVSPCRVLDTRNIRGPLEPGDTLHFNVRGLIGDQGNSVATCYIPIGATAIFANVIAVEPQGNFNNDLAISPFGTEIPGGTTINYQPGVYALNNGVLLPVCVPWGSCFYDLTIFNGQGASTHVVVDVTGYLIP